MPHTRVRWTRIQGTVDGKTCSLPLVSHPTDFNHPEPIRVRPPTDHNGKVFCKTFWCMGF